MAESQISVPRLPLTFLPNAGSSLTDQPSICGLSHNLHGALSPRGVLFIELGTALAGEAGALILESCPRWGGSQCFSCYLPPSNGFAMALSLSFHK